MARMVSSFIKHSTDSNVLGEPSQDNEDGEVNKSPQKPRNTARPPSKKKPKKAKKLTDLDLDNATESESDEYKASSNEGQSEQEEESMSEDEYMPSDTERRRQVFMF